jgi:hypothetical protein
MIRRAIILAACVASVAAPALRAQSIYHLPFIGLRSQSGDIRSISLGGNYVAVADTMGIMQLNPAMQAYVTRVTFAVGVYGGVDINDDVNYSDREGAFKFNSFAFAFRAFSRRVTLGLGYRSKFDGTGGFTVEDVTSLGDPYVKAYTREGGLQSYPVTAAFNLGRFKLGGFYALERGRLTARWDDDFQSIIIADSFSEQERIFRGHGWGAGFDVSPLRGLVISGTYEGEIDYDDDVTETFTNASNNTDYTEPMVMPARISGGVRVGLGLSTRIYAAGAYSDFTRFSGLSFPEDRLTEEWTASLAVERDRVLGNAPLRVSAFVEQLPYTLPDGEIVRRFAATVGSGWRLSGGRGKLDLALQFSQTGSVSKNELENRSIRLYVGIAGSEVWSHDRGGQ